MLQSALIAAGLVLATAPEHETTQFATATEIVRQIQPLVSDTLWSRALCVVVVPEVDPEGPSAGEPARGFMSCRAGAEWSAPVFLELAKHSRMSGERRSVRDLVLLVLNESGVQLLLQDQAALTPGTCAQGPVGQVVNEEGRLLAAEMISYVRVLGTFTGIDLTGAVFRSDGEANRKAYGQSATTRRILASRELSAPSGASAFLNALRALPGASSATQTEASSQAVGSVGESASGDATPSSGRDANIRTRIAEIRQTLDRLLADSAVSPVGTSDRPGSPSDEPVTVDRSRLLQLRQQFEALVLALNAAP